MTGRGGLVAGYRLHVAGLSLFDLGVIFTGAEIYRPGETRLGSDVLLLTKQPGVTTATAQRRHGRGGFGVTIDKPVAGDRLHVAGLSLFNLRVIFTDAEIYRPDETRLYIDVLC